MQDFDTILNTIDGNVKKFIRKLNEALQKLKILENENNKLKQKLQEVEQKNKADNNNVILCKNPSYISEEQYQKIKIDIKSCVTEIDDCIKMMENNNNDSVDKK